MNLQDIILEKIPFSDYVRIAKQIYSTGTTQKSYAIPASIVQTIGFDSYKSAISCFMDTNIAERICVREDGKWRKFYAPTIDTDVIEKIINFARRDRYKKNYFEFCFTNKGDNKRRLTLQLAEIKDGLVVNNVTLDTRIKEFLTLNFSSDHFRIINAVWDGNKMLHPIIYQSP
jgi:hypothetical protein